MKVVLFLGAGFSRAWGIPVMKEFFDYAKGANFVDNDSKGFLRELQLKAQRAANMLRTAHDNVEDILSLCLAAEGFGAGYMGAGGGDYDRLCGILHRVYKSIDLQKWVKTGGRLKRLKGLLGLDERFSEWNLTIITTNYDIVTEYCLAMLGKPCTLPCKWSAVRPKARSIGRLYEGNHHGPMLCKIHGSVNWFAGGSDQEILVENAIGDHEYMDDEGNHNFIGWPLVSFTQYEAPAAPIIIPPTFFKMQTPDCFREILRAAGKALHEAEKLVFIGFSFPESDTYVRYFLAANLAENVDLRAIHVVDPCAEAICERLKSDAWRLGNYFTDRLRAFEGEWEESHYCVAG